MEFVYVVKRSDLFDLHFPHGFVPESSQPGMVAEYVGRAEERGFFMERRYAENDSSFKQLIPYTLIVRDREVLLLKRSKKGGDTRLHDKLSIGVGGHINPVDAEFDDLLAACARREIYEEIELPEEVDPTPMGIINDDSNPVGSVHFGIVHLARVYTGKVSVRETEHLEASFATTDALKKHAADPSVDLETWSRLIAERIDDLLGHPAR
ncbi:MAG: NUDIX domain-containing protein [Planctomycetota bacterium]